MPATTTPFNIGDLPGLLAQWPISQGETRHLQDLIGDLLVDACENSGTDWDIETFGRMLPARSCASSWSCWPRSPTTRTTPPNWTSPSTSSRPSRTASTPDRHQARPPRTGAGGPPDHTDLLETRMPISLERPLRSWLVVFHDDPYAMRIVAVHPAPGDDSDNDELRAELYVANLASFYVDAPSAGQARLIARQLHDVERIRTACARLRADRPQVRTAAPRTCTAPRGHQALARASRDVALTRTAAKRADDLVTTALRAGYRHRPLRQRHLTYEQYVDHFTANTAATLYRHAALVAAGRTEEAVALLINALGHAAAL